MHGQSANRRMAFYKLLGDHTATNKDVVALLAMWYSQTVFFVDMSLKFLSFTNYSEISNVPTTIYLISSKQKLFFIIHLLVKKLKFLFVSHIIIQTNEMHWERQFQLQWQIIIINVFNKHKSNL